MNRLDPVDEMLSRLPAPPPLRPDQIARIRVAIDDDRRPRRVPRFALAIATCVALFGIAGAAVYEMTTSRGVASIPVTPNHAPATPPRPHATPPPAVIAPATRPPSPAPIVTPERVRAPVRPAAVVPRPRDPSPSSSSPPHQSLADVPMQAPTTIAEAPVAPAEPNDTALAAESQLIATSLRQLRKEHAPRAALETLDRYAAQFPRAVLADEARATRVEALVALGERRAALELLDTMTVGTELGVVRGELRLAAGRYVEAANDFTVGLIGARDDLEARALFGRAACRIRFGDRDGARKDLASYLERFPAGPQAAAARTALAEIDRERSDR